jgi:hypothetical protein
MVAMGFFFSLSPEMAGRGAAGTHPGSADEESCMPAFRCRDVERQSQETMWRMWRRRTKKPGEEQL